MELKDLEFHQQLQKVLDDTQRRLEEISQKMQKFFEETYIKK